jgi:putative hydrolase of the HAD superfamily
LSNITTIAFDADDTLWHNLIHFDAAEKKFGEMFAHYIAAEEATARVMATERRNIPFYGFGVKSFTLSMIETAIEISDGQVEASTIAALMNMGRDMLDHDIELLPHVEKTLQTLRGAYKLLLVTKGDLFHQERKVLASGLAHYFEGIEIVSDKSPEAYAKICKRYGAEPAQTVMIGNSIKSDILPMIAAGGMGVYVPFEILWAHEHEHVPPGTPRFFEVKNLSEVGTLLAGF